MTPERIEGLWERIQQSRRIDANYGSERLRTGLAGGLAEALKEVEWQANLLARIVDFNHEQSDFIVGNIEEPGGEEIINKRLMHDTRQMDSLCFEAQTGRSEKEFLESKDA